MEKTLENWKKQGKKRSLDNRDVKIFIKYVEDARKTTGGQRPEDNRIEKYLTMFSMIRNMTGNRIHESIKNLKTLTNTILLIGNNKTYAYDSRKDCIKFLTSVFSFINDGERSLKYASKEIRKLSSYSPKSNEKKAKKPYITREEVREMIKFGNTLDRAIIFFLFESGCRIGEFLAIRKEDIKITNEGVELFIRAGKTGQRSIIFVEARKYLADWLEQYPIKDSSSHVWISPKTLKPLKGNSIAKRIRIVVSKMNEHRKKKGIPVYSKPINPHNFRGSRATELGATPGITESILNQYFGWEQGGDTSRSYVCNNFKLMKKAILHTYGKAKMEEEIKPTFKLCRGCKEENSIGLNYCGRCGCNLDTGKTESSFVRLENEVKEMKAQLLKITKKKIIKGKLKKK